jgi:hypothetical protein
MAERKRSWWQRMTDRARGTGAGTEDRNIVGDVGPYDKPPGQDQPEGIETDRPPDH